MTTIHADEIQSGEIIAFTATNTKSPASIGGTAGLGRLLRWHRPGDRAQSSSSRRSPPCGLAIDPRNDVELTVVLTPNGMHVLHDRIIWKRSAPDDCGTGPHLSV
jgi:hypothetical protein